MKILILEDETIVQILVEEFVEMLGHEVVGPASTLDQGMRLAQECDAAILDVNLGDDQKSYPLAELLMEMDKPFIFVTGYAPSSVDDFPTVHKLTKPIRLSQLREAVDAHLIQKADG